MKRSIALLLFLGILFGPAPAVAASADDLRSMLEHVPGSAMADGGMVSYVDYRAVESARTGAARPGSTAEWAALRAKGEAPFGLWLAAIRGVGGGSPAFLDAFVAAGEEQPSLMGFDFFDVDRQLSFGDPPVDGLVLAGTFDPGAIVAAHEAREFTATEVADWTLICGAIGCDQGTAIDLRVVERADPFGGFLGRKQPLFVSHEILLSSAAVETAVAMRAASDDAPSLADDAALRMALDAVPADGLLRQAMLVPSARLLADAAPTLGPLPPHDLVLLMDTATADEQVTHVVLTYASEDAAQEAVDTLPRRIDAARSIRADRPLRELLDARGVSDIAASVHADPDGSGAAAILTLRAPLASPDLSATPIEASSLLYRLLVDMVLSGDAGWLAP